MFLKEGGLLSIGMDGIIVHVALLYLLYGYFFFPPRKAHVYLFGFRRCYGCVCVCVDDINN